MSIFKDRRLSATLNPQSKDMGFGDVKQKVMDIQKKLGTTTKNFSIQKYLIMYNKRFKRDKPHSEPRAIVKDIIKDPVKKESAFKTKIENSLRRLTVADMEFQAMVNTEMNKSENLNILSAFKKPDKKKSSKLQLSSPKNLKRIELTPKSPEITLFEGDIKTKKSHRKHKKSKKPVSVEPEKVRIKEFQNCLTYQYRKS